MNPYRYFSLIFTFPTRETLQALRELSEEARPAGLHGADRLWAVSLDELQAEYTRLFISAYPRLYCPPYESYYREGVVYGNASLEVGEWYQKSGLDYSYQGQPPDLVSAELDYLALTDDGEFLARMKEWIFEFTARIKEHSSVYGAAARELEQALRQEGAATDVSVPVK